MESNTSPINIHLLVDYCQFLSAASFSLTVIETKQPLEFWQKEKLRILWVYQAVQPTEKVSQTIDKGDSAI